MEFVNIELRHDNHKVGINFWHMNWQTKYRYDMFAKFKYKNLCEASVRKAGHFNNPIFLRYSLAFNLKSFPANIFLNKEELLLN